MKKFKPAKLLFGFLGLATFASLVGSVSASLAWYAYSTRATLSYTGTSVERTAQLQIGVCSPVRITSYTDNEMQEVTYNGDSNYYYFAPIGSGLTSSILSKYLLKNGYATNYLRACTSGSYNQGGSFSLKQSPTIGSRQNGSECEKSDYAHFQFVFRVAKSAFSTSTDYVSGQHLWLTDAKARASANGDSKVFKALRIYVDRDDSYNYDYIFNPSAVATGGTKVGGLLDLGSDGYYDYDNNGEIIYGEYTADSGKSESGYSGADSLVDINGSGATTEDTFTAKHAQAVRYYNNLNGCGIKTADYKSINDIAPYKNPDTGELENASESDPTSICKTGGESAHYLARVNMTIYLEGWDFSVVDSEIDHMFDLGLTFEINKVNA